MTSFYQFLIWFFTIVSLIALMYGVLSADITFIGLFICTLIISVVFHRLNETSPLQESQEQQIKDFTLEGVDKDNTEISQAIENLKQEQTKILTIFKKDIYSNQDLLSVSEIKKNIVADFVSSLSLNFEMVSKQELKDLILKLLNDLIEKNSNHLFEPSFFPAEESSYVNWVKRSLILLGWKTKKGKDGVKKLFDLFEKNGLVAGIIVFSQAKKSNIDLKQHEHYIKNGEIDFLVIITQDFNDTNNEQLSSRIVAINHHNLPKLHLKLKNFLTMK
tara:strand:+ start:196 stop:1020 length:825 start_codon:yes stop_codon:yes gene_type:complete